MDTHEYLAHCKEFTKEMLRICHAKNSDYQTNGTCLPFVEQAKRLNTTPEKVWGVLLDKQLSAIMSWIRTGQLQSEGIESRLIDAANYMMLGAALVREITGKPIEDSQYEVDKENAIKNIWDKLERFAETRPVIDLINSYDEETLEHQYLVELCAKKDINRSTLVGPFKNILLRDF